MNKVEQHFQTKNIEQLEPRAFYLMAISVNYVNQKKA